MFENPVSRSSMIAMLMLSLILVSIHVFKASLYTDVTTVVFCDVGQGDGAYIRTSDGKDIVIDAGFDKAMLVCLGKHMPFYDRTIDWAILSHADLDHYGGFNSIVERFSIGHFVMPEVLASDDEFQELIRSIKKRNVPITFANYTDVIKTSATTQMKFYWPTQRFISSDSEVSGFVKVPESGDQNEFSLVHIFSQHDVDILFTGDAMPRVLEEMVREMQNSDSEFDFSGVISDVEILKVPHHGSKNGLIEGFLTKVNPYLSIISVAKKNSFGHPSKEIVDMYKKENRTVMATSVSGDIVLKIRKDGWVMDTPFKPAF